MTIETLHHQVNEYKTKEVRFDAPGDKSMKAILPMLPKILQEHDEPGWEVCSTLIAQYYTFNPVTIGVVYRKVYRSEDES